MSEQRLVAKTVRISRGVGLFLLVAAATGFLAAFALIMERFQQLENPHESLGCDFSVLVQCSANLESFQGSVFGFPNPIIGIAGWPIVAVVGVVILAGIRFPRWFLALFLVGMTCVVLFIAWLIGQSIFVLATLCPWCMATWFVTIPTFLVTLFQTLKHGVIFNSKRIRSLGKILMAWTPLISVILLLMIAIIAQLRLDVLSTL